MSSQRKYDSRPFYCHTSSVPFFLQVTFGPVETGSTDDLLATIEDSKEDGMRSFLSNSNNNLFYIS